MKTQLSLFRYNFMMGCQINFPAKCVCIKKNSENEGKSRECLYFGKVLPDGVIEKIENKCIYLHLQTWFLI